MATELQLDEMTTEEKLQLVDELWLSMAPELESLEVSSRAEEAMRKLLYKESVAGSKRTTEKV